MFTSILTLSGREGDRILSLEERFAIYCKLFTVRT